jgi:hypothetical protein
MHISSRRTMVVADRTALRAHRLSAARAGQHGVQVLTVEQMAARLAGGFLRPVDGDSLLAAVQSALQGSALGELESIKALPGMAHAAARTLGKVWHAGIDLQRRAGSHGRLDALARLERAVLAQLPPGMLTPAALADAAQLRLVHARQVLGAVDLDGLSDVAPCWHALLQALSAVVDVRWLAGPRAVPAWLERAGIKNVRSPALAPATSVISAATPAHEALEAMRWVRGLLASGKAMPHEIALACATPERFDAHLLALRAEADIDLHFVHGVAVASTRAGQAAAALADIVVNGLSQRALRRLARLCADSSLLRALPEGWLRVLPQGVALAAPPAWQRLLARIGPDQWPQGSDPASALAALTALVRMLQQGPAAAAAIGEALLDGRALSIWQRALAAAPAQSLMATIDSMKQDDGIDGCASVAWMPAASLAGSPRKFIWLLGLNAGQWPRASTEDGLLPDHVVPAAELEAVARAHADSRDFADILSLCSDSAVLSFARRNDDGRRLGRSPLLAGQGQPVHLLRHAAPRHALSETERLAARLPELAELPQGASAQACWHNWHRDAVTAHDGAVQPGHPMLAAIADRLHSASSLQRLLRNPLGYLWQYGLRWSEPELAAQQLTLDPSAFGNLVHAMLERALQDLEAGKGLGAASEQHIAAALDAASAAVAAEWSATAELPPTLIWQQTLAKARLLGQVALTMDSIGRKPGKAYGEVPFGGAAPKSAAPLPWDHASEVRIDLDGTVLRIKGYIDRLDIASDGSEVIVRDYKTGAPVSSDTVLGGGAELQRCLYAYAARSMLGTDVAVRSTLVYPKKGVEREMADLDGAMTQLAASMCSAYRSLLNGNCLPGPDCGGTYDQFTFLLPANAASGYSKRKYAAVVATLGEATAVWELA